MIKREWSRGHSRAAAAGAVLTALVLAAVGLAACGSGGEGSSSTTASASHRCEVGSKPLLRRRRIPEWVIKEGSYTPPMVIGCFKDPAGGQVEMVGFGNVGPSVCVNVESIRLDEAHGEICSSGEDPLYSLCDGGPGCVTAFLYVKGMTELSGPLDPGVKRIRILADGKPANGTFHVAQVPASLDERLQSPGPFGFFAVFVRGCVPPNKVKVVLLGANGRRIGVARGWDAPVNECVKA